MRAWLTALVLSALLSACSAARPALCPPGADPSRSTSAVAGRVLIGVAEVIVGADLVDHQRDARSACADVGKDRPDSVAARASDSARTAVASNAGERPTGEAAEHAAFMAQTRRQAEKARPAPSAATTTSDATPSGPSGSGATAATPATQAAPADARTGRWILVRKRERTLALFDGDRRLKTYRVVLGADPFDAKLYEGDRRTPEGEYHVVGKHGHPQWQRFLLLDYPNPGDRQVYAWRRMKGLVPARGGHVPGTGGAIGIHGTADDRLNRTGVNWTWGCISLLSRDIQELYKLVDVGTLVVIEH